MSASDNARRPGLVALLGGSLTLVEARQRIMTPWAFKACEIREAMERLLPGFTGQMKTHEVARDRLSAVTRTGIVLTVIERPCWQPIASYPHP